MSIIIILTRRLPVHGRLDTSVCLIEARLSLKHVLKWNWSRPLLAGPFFVDHLLNIQLTLTGRAGAAEWPERGRRYATGSLVPIHRRSQFIRPIRL